jgi:hypothetical protein
VSADIRLYNPFNKQLKLECYHCGKEILNLNNITEDHEKCIEEQNDFDVDRKDWVMRINYDFVIINKRRESKHSEELLNDYNLMTKHGFQGTIEDFIDYKNGKR